jgi:circadian clock protein KaiA
MVRCFVSNLSLLVPRTAIHPYLTIIPLQHIRLTIYSFIPEATIAQSLITLLSGERYSLNLIESADELMRCIQEYTEKIDCLVVLNHASLLPLFNQLYEEGIILPVVVIDSQAEAVIASELPTLLYHNAEIRIAPTRISEINVLIDQAITQFLHLRPNCGLAEQLKTATKINTEADQESFLLQQQHRLAQKLKERLGYLGVYYKRNPQHFYRNLLADEKREFLEQLTLEYREIILNYFSQDESVNQQIDQFVNRNFFADMSVSQILEIHMILMDEFSQRLKLEGRSEEILLDYRLALIDILAHLGEMYRRSIPREDIPFNLD